MSVPVDMIEHMFEYEGMQTAAALRSPDERGDRGRGDLEHIGRNGAARDGAGAGAGAGAAGVRASDHVSAARAALDRITSLRSRVADMEATRVDTEGLPTADALAPLLPGGAIRAGGTYSVPESVLLAQTMLQAASAAGAWCAVVGVPSFGVEAAAAAGIDLDRLVLVPDPGDQWLAVTAALADVAQIVLTRPLGRVGPGADVTLRVTESHWSGIGQGHGYLTERRVTVTASGRAGAVRPTSTELLLPAADGSVRAAVPVAASAGARVLRPVAVAS